MFLHLLKPIWKRKFKNILLSLEILLAFLVVFAVAAFALRYWQLYQLPLGFTPQAVWSVSIQTDEAGLTGSQAGVAEQFRRTLAAMPEVEQVAFAGYAPFSNSTWINQYHQAGQTRQITANVMLVSDDFFSLMGMELERGQWFSAANEGAPAVVMNRNAARALFGEQDPRGKMVSDGDLSGNGRSADQAAMVIGVFDDFRPNGELMNPVPFVLTRYSPVSDKTMAKTILLKLKPGTPRIFEAKLNAQLKLVRSDWGYRIAPLSELRHSMLLGQTTPLMILAVIAGFLMLMVAFGLFGVLWQNTTQRIPEIGLRRALGAHAGHIYRQIIAEQLLLSSMAMAVGMVLLVQLPITGVFGDSLNWSVFLLASVVSIGLIYALAVVCSLYPAWRASRLSPTQALHHE
jgi:putative ABC transport system permease protein